MKIIINGKEKNYISEITLEELINELSDSNKKFAVELNEEIIPRSQLQNKLIVDGDKIEIITAVGGG